MLSTIIISLIVMFILFFVYREYRNEKKYQEVRTEKKHTRKNVVTPSVKKTSSHPSPKPKPAVKKETKVPTVERTPTPQKSQPQTIKPKETVEVELPSCQYPKFSHERLVSMGFSEAEAIEYAVELIKQIEMEMPPLKEAIANKDFEKIDHITHSIKGSSSTIGSGGISDLIDDFSLYIQTGKEQKITEAYFKHLERYYKDLKAQYQA